MVFKMFNNWKIAVTCDQIIYFDIFGYELQMYDLWKPPCHHSNL